MNIASSHRPRVLLIVCILCYLIQFIHAVPSLSFRNSHRAWDLPAVIWGSTTLDTPQVLDSIGFEFIFQHLTLPITMDTTNVHSCFVALNPYNAQNTYPFTPVVTTGYLTGRVTFPTMEVRALDIHCADFTFLRPQGLSHENITTTGIDVRIELALGDGDMLVLTELTRFFITDHPILRHEYSWNSAQSAEIKVKFTFERPIPLFHVSSYEITHPLFYLSWIPTMHLAPNRHVFDDLWAPYHLFQLGVASTGLECMPPPNISSNDFSSHISFSTGDFSTILTLLIPSDTTEDPSLPYTCSFELSYPPDVLYDILSGVTTEPYASILISYNSGTNVRFEQQRPTIIPSPSPSGVRLWLSPHHRYEPTTVFEFGIARVDYQYSSGNQSIEPMTNRPTAIRFSIVSMHKPEEEIVYGNGSVSSLDAWGGMLHCRTHTSREYLSGAIFVANGILSLTNAQFSGFGATCRLQLHCPQPCPHDYFGIAVDALYNDEVSTHSRLQPTLFNAFHTVSGLIEHTPLHDVNPKTTDLAPPVAIPFTRVLHDEQYDYAVATMKIQSLLPYSIHLERTSFLLTLIFPDLVHINDLLVTDQLDNYPRGWISVSSLGTIIRDGMIDIQPLGADFVTPGMDYQPDPISTILLPGRPVRSPQLLIKSLVSVPLNAVQPWGITIKVPIPRALEIDEMSIYPVLLPYSRAVASVYSPSYARITPIRTPPLTGYSYRCVTWDKMTAPYVYDVSLPLPLTEENSFPCPSHISSETEEIDVNNPSIWRRTESTTSQNQSQCFYELAAVCVTPSINEENAYDLHPLADCPSFLGELHAVPCSLAESPIPAWNYNMEITGVSMMHNEGGNPHGGYFALFTDWEYAGDPRASVDVAVMASLDKTYNDDNMHSDGDMWVVLARFVPILQKTIEIALPFYYPQIQSLYVRLSLTSAPYLVASHFFPLSPLARLDLGGTVTAGCSVSALKQFNSITHICECGPQARPTTEVEPTTHPYDFTCISSCHQGFVWNVDLEQCECEVDGNSCLHFGVCNPSTTQCTCFDGYFGEACQYDDEDDIDYVCEQLECVAEHLVVPGGDDDNDDVQQKCKVHVDVDDNNTTTVVCNCADGFTGDQCQHQAVCGVRQCVNGRLISPTGKPEECKCECNSNHITGSACNQCTLGCRNGGVANTRCTACQCPAGYIGTTCTIPVWYHTFTLRNLPQHIVELILGTTASDKEQMAILQQTMVKYLLEDYSRVLSETFIVVDGNADNSNPDDNDNDNDTRIRVRVELSQFHTVIPPANPNAPYVHIQLMLYPADMTEEMLAYALQHGLVFDWSRVTNNLDFFKKFLREQGIIDDSNGDDALTPEIIDPGCTTRECRDKIIEEESSNHALPIFTSLIARTLSISACLVAMLSIFSA